MVHPDNEGVRFTKFLTIRFVTILQTETARTATVDSTLKPGTHRRQSWIQHGRLCWKSTVAETGNKSATKSTVVHTFNFVADFGNKSATTWIRQFVAVDFVAETVDFVARVYRA